MKKIMCFGTFDLLHPGHLYYLQQARKHGNRLIVVIARDATKKKQGKQTLFSEHERCKLVQSLRIVDEAVLGDPVDHFKIIRSQKPDTLCLGYDHKIKISDLRQTLLKLGLKPTIFRIPAYKPTVYKSTLLKSKVGNRTSSIPRLKDHKL